MAKIRGQYGQFAQIGNEERKVRSLRLTDSTWETLGQIAEEKEATRADLVEELAITYYTVSDDSQPGNIQEKELEELRGRLARAESRLRESDGWQEQLTQLQRANLRNSGETEKAEARALRAEQELERLKAELATVKREKEEINLECDRLSIQAGDALNEVELLKEKLAGQQSESASLALELPDEFTFAQQFSKKYPKLGVSAKQVEKIWDFMGLR